MKTYTAEVARDGKFWMIHVPEIDRSTQALRFGDVETMANDLIEIMDEVEPGEYFLEVKVDLPSSVRRHLDQAERLSKESKDKLAESSKESAKAYQELLSEGLSQREIAKVLKVSPQRVHQRVHS